MLSPNFDESGDFQIGSLFGRVYIGVSTSENSTWRVKSVTLDGQDITDTPVDVAIRPAIEGVRITMSDKVSHVAGHVSDPGGKPHRGCHSGEPPRDPEIPLLWCRLDGEEDAIDRTLRGPVRSVVEPVGDGALELPVAHATCPSRVLACARPSSKAARRARVA